ncbi:MAG: tRNA (adenosine(37)-N6)-threonylcarbamoyltransferase complex ATPase subunit type 1 TsaE [Nitrospirae bacterium GWC2_46_6]|nr:MAG: tRNA (adenosine(37)-N6)-threonylcarbamoyltransferase complex ATPase subunit type 1 TsaE [Nitrospirae bacterium GWA2_46_11]OGW23366.1 MAG: tRNA (adenosine(37)-N6)-threonylcarbamoyltransferase complex ATPase subunit type 1 TsaE [Nitrospirae bacterium GWC2_46_6]OGW23927.1 MAG: tRNA (adenosine(37)-N6)-threonylcarbamoyltransferase complex ATPase subunit type 1 TsaE [Nitrospirae bacterium GWB2_47_37]HAK89298.1 tRNA (adenosine(37)-N6)-threonylcarbamoyltransferase complex ATPase subunit type 1 T
MSHDLRIITNSPSETEELGFKLGRLLKAKGKGMALLYGDLGAGKTVFVKGVASAFGIAKRDIGSASFVIAAEYETSPPFYHIDLYRVEREEDIEALGIWEYMDSEGVAIVEWAERLAVPSAEIYEDAVKVRIDHIDENSREIIIEGVESLE